MYTQISTSTKCNENKLTVSGDNDWYFDYLTMIFKYRTVNEEMENSEMIWSLFTWRIWLETEHAKPVMIAGLQVKIKTCELWDKK
jgi:hypothetical protein